MITEIQRMYYETGQTREVEFRMKNLKLLQETIRTYEEKIESALWVDLRKSAYESYLTEISIVLQELDEHIRNLWRWASPERVSTPLHLLGSKSRIVYEPLGVVLVIAPWNYPFQLLMTPLIGAIAAGNCVVLKPSPYAPHVAAVISEMIAEIFGPAYVTVVQGGREANQVLLAEHFDHIFFTGGSELGKVVLKAAAEQLTPVTLELGGKSPCIVGREANLEVAAKRITWGKFLNAGQTCIAPDYLFVHDEVKTELLERIVFYIRKFYGENPAESPDYPRIVRKEAVVRLLTLMKRGKVICGGEVDVDKLYVAPTVLDNITPDDPIMQQEIFGPLLPVLTFSELEEAVHYINAHDKPLALYYFGSTHIAEQVIASTSSGGVCVNDTIMHIANRNLPFGGVGKSGMGRYHGYESFLVFSNRRSVLRSTTWWDIPFKFPPYKSLSLLKKMPGFK